MRKRTNAFGIILIILGAVLILSALLLFYHNAAEDDRAGEAAADALLELQEVMQENKPNYEENAENSADNSAESGANSSENDFLDANLALPDRDNSTKMTTVTLADGYEYIGILEIPSLELTLPIMSEWDYNRLLLAPCRHFGAASTDDLVIAGHNYKRHFGPLDRVKLGDKVKFTELDGTVYEYEVVETTVLEATAVEEVQNSGHALVLYTCTYEGTTRIAVFCDRIESLTE